MSLLREGNLKRQKQSDLSMIPDEELSRGLMVLSEEMKPDDLAGITAFPRSREKILQQLQLNGIRQWSDLKGRQVPVKLVLRQRGCGMGTAEAFARLVRLHGGCVVVDMPGDWIS